MWGVRGGQGRWPRRYQTLQGRMEGRWPRRPGRSDADRDGAVTSALPHIQGRMETGRWSRRVRTHRGRMQAGGWSRRRQTPEARGNSAGQVPAPQPRTAANPCSSPVMAVVSTTSCSSHPFVTTASLLSNTRYSPRTYFNPWSIATGNPRSVDFAATVTGTADASCTPAR